MNSSKFLFASAAAAALVGLAGCGGGGGGGGASAPAPAPSPAPAPPAGPTSIDATKVTLTQLPAGPCALGLACIASVAADVDASGEITAMWTEVPSSGANRLVAANVAAGSTTPLSTGAIESGFASPAEREFVARPLGNRRFVVLHRYGANAVPQSEPTRARVVDMATSGAPSAAPAVMLPASLQSMAGLPQVVADSTRQLYAYAPGLTAPFPSVALGMGVALRVASYAPAPFSYLEAGATSDFTESADPRALLGVRGKLMPADEVSVYAAETRLVDGTLSSPVRLSTQAVVAGNGQVNCSDPTGPWVQAQAGSSGTSYVAPWRQVNAAGTGCDLIVSGQRVNTGALSVVNYVVNAHNGTVVAVWNERDNSPTSPRVLWSRREAGSTTWSTPAPVAPQVSPTAAEQQLIGTARGPSGTVAIVWSTSGGGSTVTGGALASKYTGGAWTTVHVPSASALDVRAVAINGAGQGAALFRRTQCGTAVCEELAAYRF